jgi:hypothetical protein
MTFNTQTKEVNEAIKVDKYRKLRDSIHDIVVSLSENEWITSEDLSKKLKKFNINIPPKILKRLLIDFKNGKSNILRSDDTDWLYYDEDGDAIFTTLYFEQEPVLGKGRKKAEEEESKPKYVYSYEPTKRRISLCPIPGDVIRETFIIDDEVDVGVIKRFIHKAVEKGVIDFVYEEAWEYMIENVPKPLTEGGLGIELKDPNKHKPLDGWVIPEEKDIDIHTPVLHYKHGIGFIEDVDNDIIKIDFQDKENPKEITSKRLKKDIIFKNKSIRIPINYIKRESDVEGYDVAYLKDMTYNTEIYHKTRKETGKVDDSPKVKDYITFKLDNNKKIRMEFEEFLVDQNILVSKPNEIPEGFSRVSNENNLKVGDEVYWGKKRKKGIIEDINYSMVTIKDENNKTDKESKYYLVNTLGIWKKSGVSSTPIPKSEFQQITSRKDIKVGDKVFMGSDKIQAEIYDIENRFISIKLKSGGGITRYGDNYLLYTIRLYKKEVSNVKKMNKPKGFVPLRSPKDLHVGDRVWIQASFLMGVTNVLQIDDNEYFYIETPNGGRSIRLHIKYFIDQNNLYVKEKEFDDTPKKDEEKDSLPPRDYVEIDKNDLEAGMDIWTKSYGNVHIKSLSDSGISYTNPFVNGYIPFTMIKSIYVKKSQIKSKEDKKEDGDDYNIQVKNVNEIKPGMTIYNKSIRPWLPMGLLKVIKLDSPFIYVDDDGQERVLHELIISRGGIFKKPPEKKDYRDTSIGFKSTSIDPFSDEVQEEPTEDMYASEEVDKQKKKPKWSTYKSMSEIKPGSIIILGHETQHPGRYKVIDKIQAYGGPSLKTWPRWPPQPHGGQILMTNIRNNHRIQINSDIIETYLKNRKVWKSDEYEPKVNMSIEKYIDQLEYLYDDGQINEYYTETNLYELSDVLSKDKMTYNQFERLMNIFYDSIKTSKKENVDFNDMIHWFITMVNNKYPNWAKKFQGEFEGDDDQI